MSEHPEPLARLVKIIGPNGETIFEKIEPGWFYATIKDKLTGAYRQEWIWLGEGAPEKRPFPRDHSHPLADPGNARAYTEHYGELPYGMGSLDPAELAKNKPWPPVTEGLAPHPHSCQEPGERSSSPPP